jgi:hypothetical protein
MGPKPATKLNCKMGTQIVYVPNHALGNIDHESVEQGFVTAVKVDGAFCRFWSRIYPGDLRTTANSEFCKYENLRVLKTKNQEVIESALIKIKEDWDALFKPQG